MQLCFSVSVILLLFVCYGFCKPDMHVGHQVTVAVPVEYSVGFIGRAFVMETNQMEPNFRVALSVEAVNGKYSCSLEVFLGDVKVWNSGHYSRFYVSDKCVLELSEDGDLRLTGLRNRVGWRTGTSGQGVERLQILGTGNLILVDSLNFVKWQSFNFPTDVMLWGQRLNVATRLTSFPNNSTSFYSLEIEYNKIALYLKSGKWNYSYWEFKPTKNRNITFIELGSKGLELFNDKHKKIAQIPSKVILPLRFLSLGNKTGNLGLYFYSPIIAKFEATFQALNNTCDLPLAYCNEGIKGGFCGKGEVEFLELEGVTSVLRGTTKRVNISREDCLKLCLEDCKCAAALYSSGKESTEQEECFLYGIVVGLKQVDRGSGKVFMVKVPKGTHGGHGRSNVKKWVLILVVVVDGLIILLVLGGLGYYLVQKWRKTLCITAIRVELLRVDLWFSS
ncbi:hypothetical protein FNV43_RR08702 [Rhamnella rubrinervis]|uniref:Uncharacterized protein n=1 Tax=Rhamnella rubrinervis TaxID=2594499 RepID=A0A8K0MJ15_9ROSA|nr:hypothetical protein FNV43_RR08702 [Rhamnella rubrinervis]